MKRVVIHVGLCLICFFPACSIFQPKKETDVVRLEMRITETNKKLEQIYQSVSKILTMVGGHEAAIKNIERKIGIQRPSVASVQDDQKSRPAATKSAPRPYGGQDPINLYNQALAAFNTGDKSKAKSLFDRFARTYPDHEKSPYAVSWIRFIDKSGSHDPGDQQRPASRPSRRETVSPGFKIEKPGRKELYSEALSAFQRRRYTDAMPMFETFLEDYPDHYLADNSMYWIGECQYAMKNYHVAANTFKTVIDKFPDGNKIPDATLKTGFCYYLLNDFRNARLYFQRVVDFYASSSAAPVAQRKLAEIEERIKNQPDSDKLDSLQVYISESAED